MTGRTFRIVVAGIVIVVAALFGRLRRGSDPPPPDGARPPVATADAIPTAQDPSPAPAEPADAPFIRAGARPRPSGGAESPWKEVPMAARPRDLGPELARPIAAALDAARAQMDPCFEEEDRALARGQGPKFDPADPPAGPAVLILRLESRSGGLDVVDSEVESQGTSTEGLVTCCRHVLGGWPIPAPNATPGRRFRLKYLLN